MLGQMLGQMAANVVEDNVANGDADSCADQTADVEVNDVAYSAVDGVIDRRRRWNIKVCCR